MINRLLELYRPWVGRIVVIVHPSAMEAAKQHLRDFTGVVDLDVQASPTGMLDAVLIARPRVVASPAARVWITWCDQVAVHPATIATLARLSDAHADVPLIFPTVRHAGPYVHFDRDGAGRIVGVLHRREGDAMPQAGESDAGLFSLSRAAYLEDLTEYAGSVDTGSTTGERNLLPFIPWIAARRDVMTFPAIDEMEAVGINTPEELTAVSAYVAKRDRHVLSIVIPAYNEERFIGELVQRIKAVDLSPFGIDKEIIVVDDCSRDRTAEIAAAEPGVKLRRMDRNSGKGRAVRAGIEIATGEYLIIQDADLEYDPRDYVPMLRELLAGHADAVYGSRYMNHGKHPDQSWTAYLGGRSLSLIALALTGRYLTDTVTAYKLLRRRDLAALPLERSGFELDHEITSRLLATGKRIVEVPITYSPRSRDEGKKIGLRDWFRALRTFWRYRRTA